jgi:hypothetical protein
MPAKANITTRVPIPTSLPHSSVLAALHAYEPLITANPYLVGFEGRPVDVPALVSDPFFTSDGLRLQSYIVYDRVPVIPGIVSKAVVIPCTFQSFGAGVRCRADAVGGVTVRSSYEVRRRGEVPLGVGEKVDGRDRGGDGNGEEWELVEIAEIECGSWMKPFVTRSFATAHREILGRVVDEVGKSVKGGFVNGERWG